MVFVLVGILDMRLDEIAKLISTGIGPAAPTQDEIGQAIIDAMDIMEMRASADYYLLKTELIAWLTVAIAPESTREKKSAEVQAMLDKQKSSSPGANTANSA